MPIVKINNVQQSDGSYDYKGLDLSLIVAGTQLYPEDENVAYFAYTGEVTQSNELHIITEVEYNSVKQAIENAPKPATVEDRMAEIEQIILDAMMEGKL